MEDSILAVRKLAARAAQTAPPKPKPKKKGPSFWAILGQALSTFSTAYAEAEASVYERQSLQNEQRRQRMQELELELRLEKIEKRQKLEVAAGKCYWVCSNGKLVLIRDGVCVPPVKPVRLCRP